MRGLKGIGKRKGLKGLGASNTVLPAIPAPVGVEQRAEDDPLVYQIWQSMGGKNRDLKTARQAATLKRDKLPDATTPELLVYLWLSERGYQFEFQVEANGGRRSTGGSVVDFMVNTGRNWAIRVQGDYFHESYEQRGIDEVRRKLLIGAYVGQYQIDGVVDVWESDLYADRDAVMLMAVAGVQIDHQF